MTRTFLIGAMLSLGGCAVTERARLRAEGENHLEACLFEVGNSWLYTKQCLEESVEWCVQHNLERTCGSDGLYTKRP
jgi:hypothetical protein